MKKMNQRNMKLKSESLGMTIFNWLKRSPLTQHMVLWEASILGFTTCVWLLLLQLLDN